MGKFGKGLKTVSSRTMTGGKGNNGSIQKVKKDGKEEKSFKEKK
jgi:hypothetical protein|tara:strand:- start:317 stop:448 length:132 start_codon:yes stop_codon:yes gene_type:complete